MNKPIYLWMRPVLAIVSMVGLVILAIYMTGKMFVMGDGTTVARGLPTLAKASNEMIILYVAVIQAVILMATQAFGFYFGSSQGSANKAETIDNILNGSTGTGAGGGADDDVVIPG